MLFDYDKILNDLTERKFNTSDYKRILNEDKLIRDNYSVQDSKDFGNSKQYLDLRFCGKICYWGYVTSGKKLYATNYFK